MDVGFEDFTRHPFCSILNRDYLFAFDRTGQLRFTLLVPPVCDVEKLSSLHDTIESHLFKTEPVGGRHVTINGKWLLAQAYQISTDDGYPMECVSIILGEALLRNERGHTIRLVFIDTAIYLPPNAIRYSISNIQQSVFQMFPKHPDLDFYRKFLEFFPENEPVLQKMNDYIQDFNENYIMMKGCESQVWKRIKSIWIDIVETLLYANASFACCRRYVPYMNELQLAVESYLLDGVYEVVHKGLVEIHIAEDDELSEKYEACQEMTLQDFGLPPVFVCDLSSVIVVMKEMFAARTPIDMLRLLQMTMKTLTSSIEEHTKKTAEEREEPLALTTDDLLSCLVYCIIQSRPAHTTADLDYMQNFRFSSVILSELGFNLVTFHAAISYIQSEIGFDDDTLEGNSHECVIVSESDIESRGVPSESTIELKHIPVPQEEEQIQPHTEPEPRKMDEQKYQTTPQTFLVVDNDADRIRFRRSADLTSSQPLPFTVSPKLQGQSKPSPVLRPLSIGEGSAFPNGLGHETGVRTPTRISTFLKNSPFNVRCPSGEFVIQIQTPTGNRASGSFNPVIVNKMSVVDLDSQYVNVTDQTASENNQ